MFSSGLASLALLLPVVWFQLNNRGKRPWAVFVLTVLVCLAGAVGGAVVSQYVWQADAPKK